MNEQLFATLVGLGIIYDPATRDNANLENLGTYKQLFPDWEMFAVKISKTGAKRATLMFRKELNGKPAMVNVYLSPRVTDLFRDGKITEEHLATFPVFKTKLSSDETKQGLFIGLPSTGWIPVATITPKEYKVTMDVKDFEKID